MPLRMQVGLSPGNFVLDGTHTRAQKGAEPPNFGPTSIVAQMAAWIKMSLGTEVGLGLRDMGSAQATLCLMGTQPPGKGHSSPLFSAHVYCGHGRPSQLLLRL